MINLYNSIEQITSSCSSIIPYNRDLIQRNSVDLMVKAWASTLVGSTLEGKSVVG
jgi:hypothetical protein